MGDNNKDNEWLDLGNWAQESFRKYGTTGGSIVTLPHQITLNLWGNPRNISAALRGLADKIDEQYSIGDSNS